MASLPRHYPHLSLHLADRSLTPLISSSSPSSAPEDAPPSLLRHDALASLASSALGVHDAASRLGLGSPQRILVEYGPRGPLLIQTFLDPAAAAAVLPGRSRPAAAPSSSASSVQTAVAAAATAAGAPAPSAEAGAGEVMGHRQQGGLSAPVNGVSAAAAARAGYDGHDEHDGDQKAATHQLPDRDLDDDDGDDETEAGAMAALDNPPMLLGVILAANPDESASARRATVRLERIGRQIQEGWAAEQP